MKKARFIFVLVIVMLVMAAGCAPGTAGQINSPVSTQAGTPAPNGQINIPSVSIQINIPGPNPLVNTANADGHIAGILLGIWHGFISPVTLVLSFTNQDMHMYEVYNDGSQYDLGFLLGMAIVFVVLGALLGSRRR